MKTVQKLPPPKIVKNKPICPLCEAPLEVERPFPDSEEREYVCHECGYEYLD